MHHQRWTKFQNLGPAHSHHRRDMRTRIEERIQVDEQGCWLWPKIMANGYGQISVGAQTLLAHRAAYEVWKGPITSGLEVDHLCNVRRCVNPEHLLAVPPLENKLRSDSIAMRNRHKTHCVRGHPFSGDNLRLERRPDGGVRRVCRTCAIAKLAKQRANQRPAAHPV